MNRRFNWHHNPFKTSSQQGIFKDDSLIVIIAHHADAVLVTCIDFRFWEKVAAVVKGITASAPWIS